MYTIAHLTDLHIAEPGIHPYNVDVRSRFLACLDDIARFNVDLLVLGGDLCYRDGHDGIYRWIHAEISRRSIPVLTITGNHDETAVFAEVFGLEAEISQGQFFYSREIDDRRLLFLDTRDARVSPEQLQFVEEEIRREETSELILFMHHPPILAESKYMDSRYSLLNTQDISSILLRSEQNVSVFCGHYHMEKSICCGKLQVFVTPSSFVQIDQETETFQVDHQGFGWRRIQIRNNCILTGVRYIGED